MKTFNGSDIKVFVDGTLLGNCQNFSINAYVNNKAHGSLTYFLYDKVDHTKWISQELTEVVLVANKEDGKPVTIFYADVEFAPCELLCVSVDDMVIEVTLDFTVVQRHFEDYQIPKRD